MAAKGRIHSIETMGTLDGPGIRYVIFLQGCPLRCVFCHNRDAWDIKGGKDMTVDQLIEDIKKYVDFMKFSGGGVTVTGGEPILQSRFVEELFRRAKEIGINTAMDTSGFGDADKLRGLLNVTDLFLVSVKHVREEKHRELTGVGMKKILKFLEHLREIGKPVWIRYVIIPGLTDDPEDIKALAEMFKGYNNIELIDILPYHTMGAYKWEAMGLEYPLKGVLAPRDEDLRRAKNILMKYGYRVNIEA